MLESLKKFRLIPTFKQNAVPNVPFHLVYIKIFFLCHICTLLLSSLVVENLFLSLLVWYWYFSDIIALYHFKSVEMPPLVNFPPNCFKFFNNCNLFYLIALFYFRSLGSQSTLMPFCSPYSNINHIKNWQKYLSQLQNMATTYC